jgi:hypothetical protein
MELVGRHNVGKVVKALGSALPAGAEVEAILFDRTATRVFGDVRPATPQNLAAIETAIAKRGASNGSDMAKAFELAKQVIAGARGQAMVVVVTDGVLGELADQALVQALGAKTSSVDVHAIVLDPAHTKSPGAKALRSPVNLYGGAYARPHPTAEHAAVLVNALRGWRLDATYSAKAFGVALDLAAAESTPTLFWMTFDARWMKSYGNEPPRG